ncbi:cyclic AMP-dependent transcription factor ATF-3 [Clupea harengus]|uniref:Cyclic AMP-dependent transcription factor ATF-3 n=1 Tax=Clupea harengus TaxID=7950 RepID=A0A6P3VWH3_CLUHA|nr:cyclic AMP-dependent transcription factor ATF-3 [Clupea harengus]
MMLQHLGHPGPMEISASTLFCLSPPESLACEDFTNYRPLPKEELRYTCQNKVSIDLSTRTRRTLWSSDRNAGLGTTNNEVRPEEAERRKRRRERNKVAATKCRNKKKKITDCLQKESEKLETVNADLKEQIEQLKQQKQQLVYMLNLHRPTCIVQAQNGQTPRHERNLFIQHAIPIGESCF